MRLALLIGILVFATLPVCAGTAPSAAFNEATGQGMFSLSPGATSTLKTTDQVHWEIHARILHIDVIDDRDENSVPNPLNSSRSLFSKETTNVTSYDFEDAQLSWAGAADAVAILNGTLVNQVDATGILKLRHQAPTSIEHSHYLSSSAIGAANLPYSIDVPLSVASGMTAESTLKVSGSGHMYSWGATIHVKSPTKEADVVTGHYDDMPVNSGSIRTRHYSRAVFTLADATGTLVMNNAELYAPSLSLVSRGSLSFTNATGTFNTDDGPQTAHGQVITTVAGTYGISSDATGLNAMVQTNPQTIVGATPIPPGLRVISGATIMIGALVVLSAVYLTPTAAGYLIARNEGLSLPWKLKRAEAFASWAARADARRAHRTAAMMSWRATRNAPLDPTLHTEHAILLRQAGLATRALRAHEATRELLIRQPDPGCGPLNDFNAAIAAAALGRDDEAIQWLQNAVEKDPSLASEATQSPGLWKLRNHPDYGAIVHS